MTGERVRTKRVSTSIRTKLFAGFVAIGIITGALGAFGFYTLSKAGDIVADTYYRPLMAINFARSASFTFAQMETQSVRRRMASPDDRARIDERLDSLTKDFNDDLKVAAQRSLADDERRVIDQITDLVTQWTAMRRSAAGDNDLEALSDKISERFDMLIELTAVDRFVERRKSLTAIARSQYVSVGATALALLLSELITIALATRIIGPLSAAASVAEKIGAGEFQTVIPKGGRDETGILLNTMRVMQTRIRIMMTREQAQRRSAENRLVDAIESSSAAMMLVDASDRVVLTNSQFTRFFRMPPGIVNEGAAMTPIVGVMGALLRPTEGHDRIAAAHILSAGGDLHLGNGSWVRIGRSPTQEGGFFLLLTDISDIKNREEQYRIAKVEAEAATVAKGNFLANMSHELKTPLHAVIGLSEVFTNELFGPLGDPKYVEFSRDILAGGERLLRIINNVLDLTVTQSGSLKLDSELLDLREVLTPVSRQLTNSCAAAKLKFELRMSSEPLLVRGNNRRLAQIFDNLTSNAVKFTEPDGLVTLVATQDDTTVWVQVVDTGIGIAPEHIGVALQPFGQVDAALSRRFEGGGLGLPLAKAMAELHGGQLQLDSVPGVGTRVTVTFPRAHDDSIFELPRLTSESMAA